MYSILLALSIVFLAIAVASAVYVFTVPNPVRKGQVEIEIVASNPTYTPSQQVQFKIYVSNNNDWSVPYPTDIFYYLPPVGCTGSVMTYHNSPFPPHSKTLIQSPTLWTPSQPGNYALTVTPYMAPFIMVNQPVAQWK